MVEFAILGPLEAREDSEPIPLGGPKQRALLAMLLLEAGRVVSTDRLVEALWEGDPPATAVASLQNFVAQLRKALGPDVVETRTPGYLVRLGPEQLDLARVRSLVDAARASEPVRRASLLDDALATLECRRTSTYDGGDHVILLGEVEEYKYSEGEPLVFHSGRYRIATRHPDIAD